MAKLRGVVFCLAVVAGTCVLAQPAGAGGSVWYFDRPFYEPGDLVVAGAAVSWGHWPELGTPDDGPFGAWIIRWSEPAPGLAGADVPEQIERARYVGDLRIVVGGDRINGVGYGPNVAWVEFRLPNVAPGPYSLLHCNYPCTKPLGDITWGLFWVGPPPPGGIPTSGQSAPAPEPVPTPPSTSPPTTTTSTSASTTTTAASASLTALEQPRRADSNGWTVSLVVAGGVVLAAAGAVTARRRGVLRRGRWTRAGSAR
jgi:hypothetical protein